MGGRKIEITMYVAVSTLKTAPFLCTRRDSNPQLTDSKLAARTVYYLYLGPLCPWGIGMGVKIVYFVHPFHSFQAIGIYESVCQGKSNLLARCQRAI